MLDFMVVELSCGLLMLGTGIALGATALVAGIFELTRNKPIKIKPDQNNPREGI